MTMRDLLSHTSGLTYGFMERTNVDAAYRKLARRATAPSPATRSRDMVDALATLPLEFSPGTRWNYSVSTDVLGYLIEVISGQPLDAYLREHVFEPLGMRDTGFVIADRQVRAVRRQLRAPGRRHASSCSTIRRRARTAQRALPLRRRRAGLDGARLLSASAAMLRNRGELDGVRLLGRKTVELMTMNHLPGGADLTELAAARRVHGDRATPAWASASASR